MKLDITKVTPFVGLDTINGYKVRATEAQKTLENGTCPGNDFLGWLHLPSSITPEFLGEVNIACSPHTCGRSLPFRHEWED